MAWLLCVRVNLLLCLSFLMVRVAEAAWFRHWAFELEFEVWFLVHSIKERPSAEREFYLSAGLIRILISTQVEEKNLRNSAHIDARLNSQTIILLIHHNPQHYFLLAGLQGTRQPHGAYTQHRKFMSKS